MSTAGGDHFRAAIASFKAGKLVDAEQQFKETLRREPRHIPALNLLGVLLTHEKRYAEAEHYIKAVIETGARSDATLYNYAIVLKALKRPIEALARLDEALAIDSTNAETWNVCGTVLNDLNRHDDAIGKFDRALRIRPNYAEAFYNKGRSLVGLKSFDEACSAFDKTLVLNPEFAEAWVARGVVLSRLRRDEESLTAFRRAYALKPTLFEAVSALVRRSLADGNVADALTIARRALVLDETSEAKSLLGLCLCSPLLHPGMGDLRDLLLQALTEPWARPSELAATCAHFLVLNPAIRDAMARAVTAGSAQVTEGFSSLDLEMMAKDRLFGALLEITPVCGLALERCATALRSQLLRSAVAGAGYGVPSVLALHGSLARQCFINGYVFDDTTVEIEQVAALHDALVAAIASDGPIGAPSLIALATYMPLCNLPGAARLLDRKWPEVVEAVLTQQVRAPIEEQALRATMPTLTAVEAEVSVEVRRQYEENPYPQWVKAEPAGTPKSVDGLLRERFPESNFVDVHQGGEIEILVAGCGTGRHAIDAARRFEKAQVLAIDISLTSLCYAQRQTSALGLSNVRYAQADITGLASIGQSFAVIESVGVLHHLADPFGGWRVLLSMLRPHGVMLIGLYSEIARRDIAAARAFCASRGYRPVAEDIRRSRQELLGQAEGTPLNNVTTTTDFFSLSECRDLLFHVQEHCLTLPRIAEFLAENGLQMLGFDLDAQTQRKYAKRFPDDVAMNNLANWHRYEIDNPSSFRGMYQFWVQKK
jgi:tetratricopeptide (TPR) repeat protein/2-polyprenyl-3-methyl-5-hydroxy-6-metoxy-1,4-benzoquinol methylase